MPQISHTHKSRNITKYDLKDIVQLLLPHQFHDSGM